ncbi:hypothetical protein B0T10DRAFT_575400 [Thelonectria olida]|uniref:Prion-inhibition and propagation HeLo domain-containing protein n=1 Tax=Thelonectria olida TaxID=1576542 RepID=A0A9P9ANR9_9HYPO|nr:hypothetical protein B0T10DRAFT_575400 [Thelonectria olida]
MAVEPVGATLGLLGLVGSIVEAIHFGYAIKDMPDGLRTARMKLELEGSFLQAWAENVLLVDEGLSGGVRAIPSKDRKLIKDTLEELLKLFDESSGLVEKYANPNNLEPLSLGKQAVGPGKLFRWLSIKQVPRPKALKWAIREGARLEGLVSNINFFRGCLEKMLPMNMELFKLQILVDTVSESTVDHLDALRKAAEQIMIDSPADAPAMQAICAAALIREKLPPWEIETAHLKAYIATLSKDITALASKPPADMTLWQTQLRDTNQSVIVEWRLAEDAQDGLFERDVIQLANLLSSLNQHPDAHLPRCLGYVKQSNFDGNRPRYGLIFSIAGSEASVGQTIKPVTLLKAIQKGQRSKKLPDLADRLRMALELSISVFQLMAARWVHKGITSANIALSSVASDKDFVLLGFQVARPEVSGQVSRDLTMSHSLDSYRHPAGVSTEWGTERYNNAGGYRREFDIYSLGAVMAEIGLWRSLEDIRVSEDGRRQKRAQSALSAAQWTAHLLGKVRDEMPGAMGGRFTAAVGWCLGVGDEDATTGSGSLLSDFEDNVLRRLMACRI